MLNRHSWPWQQRSKIGLVPPHPRVPQGKSKSNRRPFQNKVVQDVAKKRKKKRIEPMGKISGSQKTRSSHKKYVFSRLTNFLFFFLLKFSFSEKAELYNCVDMIKKQPPGITCCLLPSPQIFKKKKLKKLVWTKKKSMKIVVKFEASSVISLIPYKSCDHHAPFLRNQIVEMSRPPPTPTRF